MPTEPDALANPFGVIAGGAERLSKSVLGTLALFLLLIYFISGTTLMLSRLSETNQTILVLFVTLFPLVVLWVFFRLVTRHYREIIDPGNLDQAVNNQIALKLFGIESVVRERGEESAEALTAQKGADKRTGKHGEPSSKREIDKSRDWYSPEWRQRRYLFRRAAENFRDQPDVVFSDAKTAKDVTSIFQFIDDIGAAVANGDLKDLDLPRDFKRSVSRYGRRGATWLRWLRHNRGDPQLFSNFESITARWASEVRDTPEPSVER